MEEEMNTDRFKFRAWRTSHIDGIESRYFYDIENLYDGCIDGLEWMSCFSDVLSDNEFTIEQCTGLKDRHGKLIFEGDLVVQPNQYPYFDYAENVPHKSLNDTFGVIEHDAVPNYIGIVEWDDESVQFVIVLQCVNPLKSGISDGICHYFDEDEDLEVIGNVHDEQFRDLTKMDKSERD
jgi:uncharacterized phage protein (TIGR01671 family)